MSVNLLDLAKGHLTDALVGKAASFLGESNEATKSGLNHVLPALMGGIMNKASSGSGASDLLGMVTNSSFSDDLLGNLGGLFGGSDNKLMDLSGNLLGSIFGNKLGGITDLIGSAVGLKSGSSSGLLKMALPMLMSVIGKKVGGGGLSALTNLISGQKDYLKDAAPAGFMDKMLRTLGVGSFDKLGLADSFSDTKETVSNTVSNAGNEVKKGGNKILPWIIILALAALTFYLLKNCKGDTKAIEENIEEVRKDAQKATEEAEKKIDEVESKVVEDVNSLYNAGADLVGKSVAGFEYLGEFVKRKLSDGTELIVPSKGFESQLIDFIESDKEANKEDWFNMRRVLFETGSANLDNKSMKQIDYVAAILKAYPNVNLKLGGYTDNTGDPAFNKKLSGDRATSVMKVLIDKGIDATRLTAEGYGQEHPVADNATKEGQKLNRRVAARVTKK